MVEVFETTPSRNSERRGVAEVSHVLMFNPASQATSEVLSRFENAQHRAQDSSPPHHFRFFETTRKPSRGIASSCSLEEFGFTSSSERTKKRHQQADTSPLGILILPETKQSLVRVLPNTSVYRLYCSEYERTSLLDDPTTSRMCSPCRARLCQANDDNNENEDNCGDD